MARFDRQVAFFGGDGQARLESCKVAIVGVGGLGSHIVQQLAFLGVKKIAAIDPDVVALTNLNRLVGATPEDVKNATPKVTVAERQCKAIEPSIEFYPIQRDLKSAEAFSALKEANYVFGNVDNDGPRYLLSEFTAAFEKPYVDSASEIFPNDSNEYGGRVCFSINGDGCLSCLEQLSSEEMQLYFRDEKVRADVRKIYGVPASELNGSGPSVVTINGVVASIACTEFMLHLTGVRAPNRLMYYRGTVGKVVVSVDPVQPDCYLCKSVRGLGEEQRLDRYLVGA